MLAGMRKIRVLSVSSDRYALYLHCSLLKHIILSSGQDWIAQKAKTADYESAVNAVHF